MHFASAGTEGRFIPPKTAKQKLARKNELKAKSTLLLAIPDEHLLKFHGIKDAKTYGKQSRPEPIPPTRLVTALESLLIIEGCKIFMEAIKKDLEETKIKEEQKESVLKQQFETFTIGSREETDSAYERLGLFLACFELHDATGGPLKIEKLEVSKKPYHLCGLMKSNVPSFNKHPCLQTHDDEDLLAKLHEDAMEEIDIRVSVAKYQENRANGRQEMKTRVTICYDGTDWSEQVDWSMEFDAETCAFWDKMD
ncbi:hypothetical protein Tco_0233897 [Tanacetum coccineum]